jgi:hypothetical protein
MRRIGSALLVVALLLAFSPRLTSGQDRPPGSHQTMGENRQRSSSGASGQSSGSGSQQTMGESRERSSFTAIVTTGDRGVTVEVRGRQQLPGAAGARPNADDSRPGSSNTVAQRTSSGSQAPRGTGTMSGQRWYDPARGYFWSAPDGHIYSVEGMNLGTASTFTGQGPSPTSVPMSFNVDGQLQSIIWLPTGAAASGVQLTGPAGTSTVAQATSRGLGNPRDVAVAALRRVPLPDLKIRVNPGLGLVAVPGWFWVEGYDGQPFGTSQTVTLPPEISSEVPVDVIPATDARRRPSSYTVQVRVWPTRYEWSFGDGKAATTQSLGKAYPAESDIKHTYDYSSLRFEDGFPVTVAVEFAAEYRVNRGAAERLPSIRRTYEASYRVQEAQAILAGR